jgi:hypothetical protein
VKTESTKKSRQGNMNDKENESNVKSKNVLNIYMLEIACRVKRIH